MASRKANLKYRYGIAEEEYDKLLAQQHYGCKICGKSKKENNNKLLAVDHCHKTHKIRGLLCHQCNVGLGNFEDDKNRIKKAMQYLDESNQHEECSLFAKKR